jgi:hypothetical protein
MAPAPPVLSHDIMARVALPKPPKPACETNIRVIYQAGDVVAASGVVPEWRRKRR